MTVRADDRGSIIPLMLGIVVIALLMVAGSVAAGDAFVQQRDLQDTCDAAAIAAASAVDFAGTRTGPGGSTVQLGDVQQAVITYLGRDPDRAGVHADARVEADADGDVVQLECRERTAIAFGRFFGLSEVEHVVTSSARAPIVP